MELLIFIAIIFVGYKVYKNKKSSRISEEDNVKEKYNITSEPDKPKPTYRRKVSFVDEFVAFDVETTGLKAGKDEIIQIAAIHFKDDKEVNRFSTYVKPSIRIPFEATEVNNITDEMVADSPNINEIMPKFIDFIGNNVLVAHNASFDMRFIMHEINEQSIPFNNQVADTLSITRKHITQLKDYKLGTIVKHLKIKLDKAHDAEHDAYACGQIYIACKEKASVKSK